MGLTLKWSSVKTHYNDLYLGLGVAILFGLVSLWLIPNYIEIPSSVQMTGVSPSFWPEVISWAMVVLGLMQAASSYMQLGRARARTVQADTSGAESASVPKISMLAAAKAFLTFGALVGYYFLVEYLGMMVSSMLALFSFTLIYGERRLKFTVPLAVLVPLLLYLFFVKVANIPMPQGIWVG